MIKVIVLCGGLGTRLKSIVSDVPKPMAMVQGIPFLEILINQMYSFGQNEFIFSTSYRGDQIKNYFGHGNGMINFEYCNESFPLGTGGAVANVLKHYGLKEAIIINGDSFLDVQETDFLNILSSKYSSLFVTQVDNAKRYGCIKLNDDSYITKFDEKSETSSTLVNAGIYFLKLSDFEKVKHLKKFSLERTLLPALASERKLKGVIVKNRFIDIGIPESFELSQQFDFGIYSQKVLKKKNDKITKNHMYYNK